MQTPAPRPTIRLRTVFLSDTHLGFKGCRAEFLLDFLRRVECEQIYLVGDIIDVWSLTRSFYWPRLAAFVLAALVISVAGVLGALSSAFASPELLDFATGGNALVATLVGGASSVAGPVLGALLYTWGQDLFGTTGHLELLTGIATVVAIAFFPRGAIGAIESLGARLRNALPGRGRS